ncbi:tetratricopeptide repeat protein, partial [bacterium]|nr:tetratricopeptide repeat protein [bacterium]
MIPCFALAEEDRAGALYRLGVARLELGDAGHAIEPLKEAAALSPRDAQARVKLGYAYLKAGRRDEAERAFREAVELDAGLVEAHVGLGLAALKRREERGR